MNFYPDPTKQAHELFFSGKSQKNDFASDIFQQNSCSPGSKNILRYSVGMLNFSEHIKTIIHKKK